MTERKRVLRALQIAGDTGITQVDFDPPTFDEAKPIKRVAARIHELRAEGFVIGDDGWRDGCRVYVLGADDRSRRLFDRVTPEQTPGVAPSSGAAGRTGEAPGPPASAEPSLFDPQPAAPSSAIYGDAA